MEQVMFSEHSQKIYSGGIFPNIIVALQNMPEPGINDIVGAVGRAANTLTERWVKPSTPPQIWLRL